MSCRYGEVAIAVEPSIVNSKKVFQAMMPRTFRCDGRITEIEMMILLFILKVVLVAGERYLRSPRPFSAEFMVSVA